MLLTLTDAAKAYFNNLIKIQAKQLKTSKLNVRIKAIEANIELSFCPDREQQSSDIAIDCDNFIFYIEGQSKQALEDAIIDYKQDKLSIKAPYLTANIDLFNKIKNFLATEINPILARHRGLIKLLTVNEEIGEAVLQFGGGCKGCSMVDFTLKHSIEKSLKAKFPEIKLIRDATDHTECNDAFYK